MTVEEIMKYKIEHADGNLHDINHLIKVHSFARTIGVCEGLDAKTLQTLEVAAIVHDIACPLCREKYGNTNGKYQEAEGPALTREFLQDKGISGEMLERVVYLVGHHHTLNGIEGMDYQILIEADYLVNAYESSYSKENIENMLTKVFQTKTGKELLQSAYQKVLGGCHEVSGK